MLMSILFFGSADTSTDWFSGLCDIAARRRRSPQALRVRDQRAQPPQIVWFVAGGIRGHAWLCLGGESPSLSADKDQNHERNHRTILGFPFPHPRALFLSFVRHNSISAKIRRKIESGDTVCDHPTNLRNEWGYYSSAAACGGCTHHAFPRDGSLRYGEGREARGVPSEPRPGAEQGQRAPTLYIREEGWCANHVAVRFFLVFFK